LPHYVFRPGSPETARFRLLLSRLRHSPARLDSFDILCHNWVIWTRPKQTKSR